ncbi:MAG: immunoglobulin domain-containing protein [Eubacterium sp.]|nr:immunoglobulin domain-containing protein [Eubacterium sp.]
MKLFRKITAVSLAAVLAVTSVTALPAPEHSDSVVYAAAQTAEHYFYNQLTDEQKPFYDAMQEMYLKGIFKTGNGDYDLIANGMLTEAELEAYIDNYGALLTAFTAARDAFYADNADIFYVDFSYLSIRVTTDYDGGYHAYIGTGRSDSYYTQGFTSESEVNAAIAEYDAMVDDVVKQAEAVTADGDENLAAKQIEFVHNYLTTHTSYRREITCKPENMGVIRTAYGSLVKGESLCEGYSRAFKTVLDRLGIPCVLVYGVFRHSENVPEVHMWTDVMIDGEWYAVDVTMDDPVNTKSEGVNGLDGYESTEYLLVGQSVISRQHVAVGVMSESDYEFSYPIISMNDFGVENVSSGKGLVVNYDRNGTLDGETVPEFRVSFRGMGVAEAAKEGWYFLVRHTVVYVDGETKTDDAWAYILPDLYPAITDTPTEVILPYPHVRYLEFAITDIAPGPYLEDPWTYTTYRGDPFLLEAYSGVLDNPDGTYIAPPYVKTITPSIIGRLEPGKTYNVTVTYDDVLISNGEELDYTISCHDRVMSDNVTGHIYSKIENLEWDGESTITFDFTPSPMYADDSVVYDIAFKGLIGKRSNKAPNSVGYVAANYTGHCAFGIPGYNWRIYGKPALLENSDLSTTDWVTKDGTVIGDDIKSRIVLVASNTLNAQTDTMNEMIEETGEKVLSSSTYNINLTVCQCVVIKTGEAVRVSVGFPNGYGPEDAGVTFKAYHFIKNDADEIIGVEEIPCVITPYGLVITCSSFSPFAIVAVEDDGSSATSEKTVILSNTSGGSIIGADSITTLSEGESLTVTVSADDGYSIDAIVVNGEYISVTDGNSMTVTVSYDDIAGSSTIIDAQFVAESVLEKEAERGEEVVLPQAVAAEITTEYEKINVTEGKSLTIEAAVTEPGDVNTYQWYKDGEPLEGQNSKDLYIESASLDDSGEYTLVVTTMLGATTATAEKTVTVMVSECKHENYTDWEISEAPTCTDSGLESRTCVDCGAEDTRIVPAAGHKETIENAKDATCTEAGYTGDTVCEVCGETLSEGEEIPALEHNYVDGVCTVCGEEDPDYVDPDQTTGGDNTPDTPDGDDKIPETSTGDDKTPDTPDDNTENGGQDDPTDTEEPSPGDSSGIIGDIGKPVEDPENPNTGYNGLFGQIMTASVAAVAAAFAIRKKRED